MNVEDIEDVFNNQNYNLPTLLDKLKEVLSYNIHQFDSVSLNLIDKDFLDEIKGYDGYGNTSVYFGKSLRDIKCIIQDESGRKHEIFMYYKGPKKIRVTCAKLPSSNLIERDYSSLCEVITAFTKYTYELSCYFHQLEQIDQTTAVMDPANPTFSEDYRRIYLDDRTWLHIEVTADGLATNIHLVGHTEQWHNKLQAGLLLWDHDKNIVENILSVFELSSFSFPAKKSPTKELDEELGPTCSICLCTELPEASGLPQPLCKNFSCGVFFHRSCLYQWLVACAGNRQPAFGVATGLCPCCFRPIDCSEKDN